MADNNRTPKSLQGLFNFCVEATGSEDVESTSQFQAMTDEDKSFINAAIRAAMGSDPVKQMIEDLKVLTSGADEDSTPTQSTEDEMINALEDLQMHCENMDLANDFHKIGGYQVLPWLLQHPSPDLRWRTADLVATLVQNNDYSQAQVLNEGFMKLLLQRLDEDADTNVKIKLLYAVSCLSRDYEPAQEELMKRDGYSVLLRAMQVDDHKLQTKAAFLFASLCTTQAKVKETLCNMGCVELIAGLLHRPHGPHHEHLLHTLTTLTEDYPQAISECRRPELRLRETLIAREASTKGKEESQEEYGYTCTLLSRCFPNSDSADR